MEIQNQVGSSLRGNLTRLREVLDEAVSQGVEGLGQVADRICGDVVGLVARLGGWRGRKRDPPGAQLLWHGYTQLVAMAFAFELRDEFG